MNTEYELVNKMRAEIMPVNGMDFYDGYVIVTSGDTVVRFENPDHTGDLVAERGGWAIRRVGSNLSANGEEVIDDAGVATPVKKKK